MTVETERIVRVDSAELWCAAELTGPAGGGRAHLGPPGRRSPHRGPDAPHAVLLYSGGPGCPVYLRPVAELLPPGFLAIRFDPRGCGRSTAGTHSLKRSPAARADEAAPTAGEVGEADRGSISRNDTAPGGENTAFTVEQAIRDLEAIRLAFDIRQWTICGHSFGADLALLYALSHRDRVRNLICLAGGRAGEPREWYRAYRARRDLGDETVPEFEFPVNVRVKARLSDDWRRTIQRPSLLAELAGLDVPAHFIYPEGDIRPSWPEEQVASLLPRGEFRLLPDCDHFMWRGNSGGLAAELQRALGSDGAVRSR